MKVGIIGCGGIAQVHVRGIRAYTDAEIVGVADTFVHYARSFAAAHDIGQAFGDAATLIEATRPEVVHITTPPATHAALATECLDLGCHVLVEKPMASSVAEADRMIEAARRNGRQLCIDHNYCFEPVVLRAIDLARAGRFGRLVAVEVSYAYDISRYPAMVQEGAEETNWAYRFYGGPLEDQMPHAAALALGHVASIENVTVLSKNLGILPRPWADDIRVLVDGGNVHADIHVSYHLRPDAVVLTLRGTEGTASANLRSMVMTAEFDSVLPRAAARGLAGFRTGVQNIKGAMKNAARVATGRFDKTGGIGPLVARFYQAIEQGTEPPVSMEEGRRVVELIRKIWPEPVKAPEAEKRHPARGTKRRRPRVLVTGASGFIGSHLVQRLVGDSVAVRAMARPSSPGLGLLKKQDVDIVFGDLSDAEAVDSAAKAIETIYHVGAAMGGDWETHRRSTVLGTENVLRAAAKHKCNRVVLLSSLVVYDLLSAPDGATIDEGWPLEPAPDRMGPYTRAKIATEKLALEAHGNDGVPVCIVRPGIVLGPRSRIFFPHMGYRLKDKVFIVPGKGGTILPIVYVGNLVDGLLSCARQEAAIGKTYNFVDDGTVTVLEYLEKFIEETKSPSRIIRIPFLLPYGATAGYELAAAAGILPKGVTSRRQLRWKQKSLRFSSERAKKDLGWQNAVSLDAGLAETFAWYRDARH